MVEQALETAAWMLGSDKSRGYCLEMICADFLAGVHLEESCSPPPCACSNSCPWSTSGNSCDRQQRPRESARTEAPKDSPGRTGIPQVAAEDPRAGRLEMPGLRRDVRTAGASHRTEKPAGRGFREQSHHSVLRVPPSDSLVIRWAARGLSLRLCKTLGLFYLLLLHCLFELLGWGTLRATASTSS